ncbi:MAG TPA: class I SAM-dependent methyltransferase [Gammaproteobacteria bacterium]|nr:class I SAM-dependent methyltransferase [Gammaproteobacteria bacterium]
MGHVTPQPLGDILRLQIPGFEPPDFTDGRSFNILIAGCGTGRHALRAALHYAGAQVLAIDISRRSLGYAKRMAEKLGARNIEFLHIDLFDLPHLGRRFEVIETIGTLETLTFPKRGWQILRDLLVPHGLLHVGSYSELARRPVVMARRRIAELGLTASIEDIRSFRARVLAGELGEDGRRLLSVGDFYTISGCRDFLFHVNEHRFMLADIATLLRELRLTFLGFVQMRRPLVEAYRQRHPDDPAARHLERWAALEINEPEIFTALMNLGMYYYWVQAD